MSIFADYSVSRALFEAALSEYETRDGVWATMIYSFEDSDVEEVNLFLSQQAEYKELV